MEKFSSTWDINVPDDILRRDFSHLNKIGTGRRRVFSSEEDRLIAHLVSTKQCTNWYEVAQRMPGKTPRQCRDRWVNYICPTNSFEPWTQEDDQLLIDKINEFGTRWTIIAEHMPGRSDNCIKNRWYASLRIKCKKNGHGKYYMKSTWRSKKPKPTDDASAAKLDATERENTEHVTNRDNSVLLMCPSGSYELGNADLWNATGLFDDIMKVDRDMLTNTTDIFGDWY